MLKRVVFLLTLCGPFIFTGCETSRVASGGPYHVTAYKPNDPSKVAVKVSLSKQNIYVMEGDRCLMAVACSVGVSSKPTPRGNFTIYRKEEDKSLRVLWFPRSGGSRSAGRSRFQYSRTLCWLPDGILVRVRTSLWISSGLRASGPADARLHSPEG